MTSEQPRHVDARLVAWLAIAAAAVLVLGLILIASGLNEPIYSTDPILNGIFGVITQAGDELFFIVVISFLYFGVDKVFSRRLLYGFLISTHVNLLAKAIVRDPRPPTNGTEDSNPYYEEGFGFPSGHAQSTVAFWGYSIATTRDRPDSTIVKVVGAAMLVLVPISRLVLGVHDVQDVMGGFVIGLVVLLAYLLVEERLMPMFELDWTARISIGVAACMTLWVFSIIVVPDAANDFGQPCGLLLGITIGIPIEEMKIKFNPASLPIQKRVLAGIIGSLLTIGTYLALSLALGKIAAVPHVWRFLRYAILGLLVSLVYTWLLKKIVKQ
ncbi:MAG: phosphatase PAP2 family protein [Candidatus Sigynarchaeota archaeon]